MSRGWLRIYLGAAPGVGKTFAMLGEGSRRQERGTDVVIGLVETHGRRHTAEQIGTLEVIPRRRVTYRGGELEEMDLLAILDRAPEVVLVDELAHTNAPGLEHAKRFEDVETLLDAGINVITTLNLQHLESVNDVVQTITGIVQRETVPDSVVRAAQQIELVDMTPEALRRRMAHGNVYAADRIDAALANFFRPGNLAALRELALLWLADRVDDDLADYRQRHGIAWTWETKERVVVSVSGAAGGDRVIRRAARIAARARGELIGVTVRHDDGIEAAERPDLASQIELVDELGGRYLEVVGTDVASALVATARAENATQLVIGATKRSRVIELVGGSVVQNAVRAARGDFDVHVIGLADREDAATGSLARPRRASPLPERRRIAGVLLGLVAFPLVTWLLVAAGVHDALPLALSAYMVVVIAVAAVGGLLPGVAAGIAAFFLSNWEFTPPLHTFTISNARDVLALVAFMMAAVTVSLLVDIAARRSAEARRAQSDARALARIASHVSKGDRALDQMLEDLVRVFGLRGARLVRRGDDSWSPISAGEIDASAQVINLDDDHVLEISGRELDPGSAELLQAVVAQLVTALERHDLLIAAEERLSLKRADELRSGLLAAVSHDLRTPLASIKAGATALLSGEASFSEADRNELLRAIDSEADRLDGLVEDLLDMSRINEGSVDLATVAVDLGDVVAIAIEEVRAAIGPFPQRVELTGDDVVVTTDPVLVTRIMYNLILNALTHGGGELVVVDVSSSASEVTLRVIDQGSGISQLDREAVLMPFQRRGDTSSTTHGLGLGLAIAAGFADALGGELLIDDTPGGGCTMVLRLAHGAGERAELTR